MILFDFRFTILYTAVQFSRYMVTAYNLVMIKNNKYFSVDLLELLYVQIGCCLELRLSLVCVLLVQAYP